MRLFLSFFVWDMLDKHLIYIDRMLLKISFFVTIYYSSIFET